MVFLLFPTYLPSLSHYYKQYVCKFGVMRKEQRDSQMNIQVKSKTHKILVNCTIGLRNRKMTKYAVTILKALCKATGNSDNRHTLFLKWLPFTYYIYKNNQSKMLFFLYFTVFSVSVSQLSGLHMCKLLFLYSPCLCQRMHFLPNTCNSTESN